MLTLNKKVSYKTSKGFICVILATTINGCVFSFKHDNSNEKWQKSFITKEKLVSNLQDGRWVPVAKKGE